MSVLGPFRLVWLLGVSQPHAHLMERALSLPDVKPGLIEPAVRAAIAQETEHVPAELLVSLAWSESRFEPGTETGHACGIEQVIPADLGYPRAVCWLWENDLGQAMAAGAEEIETELRDPRVHGDLRVALLYRACGNRAFVPGRCAGMNYVSAALHRAEWLRGASRRSRPPRPGRPPGRRGPWRPASATNPPPAET